VSDHSVWRAAGLLATVAGHGRRPPSRRRPISWRRSSVVRSQGAFDVPATAASYPEVVGCAVQHAQMRE